MKKIIVSVLTLLTFFGLQSSALDKSKVKKIISTACTKVLPAVAVTAGVGFLIRKLCSNSQNNSINSEETIRISEQEAYADGIRYIVWHGNMCWFNASILQLYYNDFYREKLLNLKEHTYSEKQLSNECDYNKKITIELSKLIKKIHNSKSCMCEISENEYTNIIDLMKKADNNIGTYGLLSESCYENFCYFIDKYLGEKSSSKSNDKGSTNIGLIIWENNHYYNLYYVKNKRRLYIIGKNVKNSKEYNNSIKLLNPTSNFFTTFTQNNQYLPAAPYVAENNNLILMDEYCLIKAKKETLNEKNNSFCASFVNTLWFTELCVGQI